MVRVPKPVSGCDLKSLPLSPAEAYVLSRIDGNVSDKDLSLLTGVPADVVEGALERLEKLGAIHFGVTPVAAPKVEEKPASGSLLFARRAPTYEAKDLSESVDLDDERKKRILDAFYQLERIDYYEILGVPRDAEKKAIKTAYYALAPDFHPDKFFRKNLGSYRVKIEQIFTRVTLAHDTLTSRQRRAEYDEYLAQTHQTKHADDSVEAEVAAIHAQLDAAARAAVASMQQPSLPPQPRVDSPEMQRLRRETLARKLGAGMNRGTTPPPMQSVPPIDQAQSSRLAGEALKARYDAAVAHAKQAQIRRYLELGRTSLRQKDYAGAANAFRIAQALAPEDPDVIHEYETSYREAAAQLADGYLKQAQYEMSSERWGEAAQSLQKVIIGRPDDARAHERYAHCLLASQGNVRKAVEHARRAVEIAPKVVDLRVTLAKAYYSAGLEKSADGEVQRMKELAPNDAKIREQLAMLKDFAKEQAQKLSQKPG
jgi:curved DNA-binding protein CbpA